MNKREAIEALKGQGFLHLSVIESVLRQETSIVDEDDVALLMTVFYEKAEVPVPQEIQDELTSASHYHDTCGTSCALCDEFNGDSDGDSDHDEC